MKRFGQTVLQVESYNIDVILQIFKWSISPGMPFFESIAKKPPITMDDLFRWVNKHFILENDVRAASQQVLVTNYLTKNDKVGSSKPLNQLRQANKRRNNRQQHKMIPLPSTSPMRDSSHIFVTCQTLDRSQSRQIRIDGIGTEGAPIIRITTTPSNNARICITWWRNLSRSDT